MISFMPSHGSKIILLLYTCVYIYIYVKCTIHPLKARRTFHKLLMWWRYTTYTVYVLQTYESQWKDSDVPWGELDPVPHD